jgi:hypothetical protein
MPFIAHGATVTRTSSFSSSSPFNPQPRLYYIVYLSFYDLYEIECHPSFASAQNLHSVPSTHTAIGALLIRQLDQRNVPNRHSLHVDDDFVPVRVASASMPVHAAAARLK